MRYGTFCAQPFGFSKLGRTIADFEGAEDLEAKDLSEAAQYRMLDRNLWLQS
jgi:predicted ATPase with chaperone activity